MSYPSLIDYWRIKKAKQRLPLVVRPFHHLIAADLTRLVLGTLPKRDLMILMPPRCGKTDLGDQTFLEWAHSYFPDSESIITSYGSDLAEDNTWKIRNVFGSDWYRSMCGSDWGANVVMVGEKASGKKEYFHTTAGGSFKGIGVGGGITGFGAGKLREEFGGCVMIDDPLKAQDGRNSPAARRTAVDYIEGTLNSRRNRGEDTPRVLIMQRLHPQDPAGHLLANEREKWHVLQIPALDERTDQSIWEERISTKMLHEMREAQPDVYYSQYAQSPADSVGTIFKPAWWRLWTSIEEIEKRVTLKFITADTAFKAEDHNDWNVLQLWGCLGTSGLVLLDQFRKKMEFPELLREAKNFWTRHSSSQFGRTPATEFWIEDKASGQSLVQMLRSPEVGIPARAWSPDEKRNKSTNDPAHHIQTSTDKVGRANQVTMPISQGRIILPDPSLPGYGWVKGFINEHEAFAADDSHLYDDQVDGQTMAGIIWQSRGGGRGPIPEGNFIVLYQEAA